MVFMASLNSTGIGLRWTWQAKTRLTDRVTNRAASDAMREACLRVPVQDTALKDWASGRGLLF